MSGGTRPLTPSPTAAYAPTPTTRASTSRNSSAPRRRRWTNCMSAPACCAMSASARARGRRAVGSQALNGALGLGQVAGADARLDRVGREGVELGDADVGGLVGVRERDARYVGLDAAEDRDHAVLLA